MSRKMIYERYIKRTFDILISFFSIIILLPLFIVISILVLIDSGRPVFFKQQRIGKNGRIFKIIKFRTMIVNAEKKGDGLSLKSSQDPRITRVGKFLRNTSLDELPQLFNVLKGDMSIIGPRPPVVYHPYKGYDNYPNQYKDRFNVRPGLGGLAQVTLRNTGSWTDRFVYDLEYVKNVSFKNDLRLIFSTFFKVLRKEDIYER